MLYALTQGHNALVRYCMCVQLCSRWLYLFPCTGVLERNEAKSQQMVAEVG